MKRLTAVRAIKLNCLNCQCYSKKSVRNCEHSQCPLWHFRMGTNPNRRGCGQWKGAKTTKDTTKGGGNGNCPIVSHKNNKSEVIKSLVDYPLSAIRKNCLACCLSNRNEVTKCACKSCPNYLYRFGRKPTLKEIDDYLNNLPETNPTCEADIAQSKLTKQLIGEIKELRKRYVNGN